MLHAAGPLVSARKVQEKAGKKHFKLKDVLRIAKFATSLPKKKKNIAVLCKQQFPELLAGQDVKNFRATRFQQRAEELHLEDMTEEMLESTDAPGA